MLGMLAAYLNLMKATDLIDSFYTSIVVLINNCGSRISEKK